jgi:hypothetical protein
LRLPARPVATAVVVGAAAGEALDDILDRLTGCHGRPGR